MSQTVILEIPESFLPPLQRTAAATKQTVEKLLLNALQTSLPPLEDLPPNFTANLTALENLDNESLQRVLRETVAVKITAKITALLKKRQARSLTEPERETLNKLQQEADLTMLRKARAAVLLRFRGQRLPTLTELAAV